MNELLWLLQTLFLSHHSKPELITLKDDDSYTPILTAAARSKLKAFQCLMNFRQCNSENPVFSALKSKENPVAILKVHKSLEAFG